MLPSDHFVRMYNELFKMLEKLGHTQLQAYWKEVSRSPRAILAPYIVKDGFKGMYDYWEKIRLEENCEAELTLTEGYFEFNMLRCPSRSKALDNDAGVCELYCDHCAGWVEPLINEFGYISICDIISRSEPRCRSRIYKDPDKASSFKQAELLAKPYST